MKNKFKILIATLLVGFLSTSCEGYLEVPSDATLTDEVIFSEYKKFQGYIDPCYAMIMDANSHNFVISSNMGTESASNSGVSPAWAALNMNYSFLGVDGRSIWLGFGKATSTSPSTGNQGLYHWWAMGSRLCNTALDKLELLRDTVAGDKAKIEGQARFFRAYYHFEIARAFGSIPYLDKVYTGDDAKLPRYWTDEVSGKKDCQAVYERCARDLRIAADLLPVTWEDFNLGRVTKGAALSLLAKVYLYAGSPLYEEAATKGNSAVTAAETAYNKIYMTKAAEAAAEVIKLGVYELTPFVSTVLVEEQNSPGGGYRRMFTTIDGTKPSTKEDIFRRWKNGGSFDNFCRIYAKGVLGSNVGGYENPLLRFMDKFEMADGTQYKPGNAVDGGYDDNFEKFTNLRDPRFQFNYRLHRETIGTYTTSFENKGNVYFPGAIGPFMMTKYWYPLADNVNKQLGKFTHSTPNIRYADLLLMYAEAVFESTGNPDASIGGVMTAREALNLVRTRVNMPPYNPATYAVARIEHGEMATDHPFRLALRNERNVELAYEGHLWFDIRRWKIIHRLENKVWVLDFNKEWTAVSRVVRQPFLFEMRNYWLPFAPEHTQIYDSFTQNPGW